MVWHFTSRDWECYLHVFQAWDISVLAQFGCWEELAVLWWGIWVQTALDSGLVCSLQTFALSCQLGADFCASRFLVSWSMNLSSLSFKGRTALTRWSGVRADRRSGSHSRAGSVGLSMWMLQYHATGSSAPDFRLFWKLTFFGSPAYFSFSISTSFLP